MGKLVEENAGQEQKKDQIDIFNQPVKAGEQSLGRKEKKDGGEDKRKQG